MAVSRGRSSPAHGPSPLGFRSLEEKSPRKKKKNLLDSHESFLLLLLLLFCFCFFFFFFFPLSFSFNIRIFSFLRTSLHQWELVEGKFRMLRVSPFLPFWTKPHSPSSGATSPISRLLFPRTER